MSVDKITSLQPLRLDPAQYQQLHKGDIFRATVVDVKDGQAVLRLRGELQTAISAVPLQIGETALFQVKDIKDSLLVLQKQGSNAAGFSEKTLGNILRELGLPVSLEGQNVVSHFLSKELPLSKELIEYTLKGLNSVPENLKESFIKISAWLYGAGIKDPDSYQNVLKTLLQSSDKLNLLDNLMDNASATDTEVLKSKLTELIAAQRDINQSRQDSPRMPDLLYYPLPLYGKRQQIPAQLYLVMNNKSRSFQDGTLSLLLSVKGEQMGMLWFDIKVRDMALNITTYTEHPDVSNYLTGTWQMLKNALENSNFRIDSFTCREKAVTSVFELADELGHDDHYRSVDIKV